MSMLSNLDLIRRVPLFSMLTVDQAQAIADSVVKRRFRRGELRFPVCSLHGCLWLQPPPEIYPDPQYKKILPGV